MARMPIINTVKVLPHDDKRHEAPFSCVPADRQSVAALERSRKGLFCVSGRCFVVGVEAGSHPARSENAALSRFDSERVHHKASSPVRARIDTANGPAWAAPKKHRHLYTRGHAVRPFRQGSGKNWGQVVRHAPFRVNDGLKGLWMLQSIGSGQISQMVGYHPWATYGQKETGKK